MKKKKLKLSLNKMTVAKINDTSTIKGGSQEITYAGDNTCPHTACDIVCNPQESVNICIRTEYPGICKSLVLTGC